MPTGIYLDVKFILSELGKFVNWKWFNFPEEGVICDSDVLLVGDGIQCHQKVRRVYFPYGCKVT